MHVSLSLGCVGNVGGMLYASKIQGQTFHYPLTVAPGPVTQLSPVEPAIFG